VFAGQTDQNQANQKNNGKKNESMLNPLKLQEMLGQAKQMQEQIQQKLASTVVEASSGGGAVTVKMNGKKEVLKVSIDPAAVSSLTGPNADVEMLEDLVAAAVNEAGRRADEIIKSNVQGMLGGLNLPPGLL
jgi:DNA-binding YbaB/EbfC family protein